MKSQTLIYVFGTLFFLSLLTTMHFDSANAIPIMSSDGRFQACGTALADLLQKFCTSGYNSYNANGEQDTTTQIQWRRKRRGIFRECCSQSCTLSNIYSYCYFDPSLTTSSQTV